MKSILQIYKLGVGPSSTLNMVPYNACREIAVDIHKKGTKVHHVEVYLYNEFARLEKEAGIMNDIRNAFGFSTFDYVIKTDKPVPPGVKTAPYAFDVVIFEKPEEATCSHRVIATGGGNYYFTEVKAVDPIPCNTFEEVKTWFKKNPKKTFLDFCMQGDKKEEIIARFNKGEALASISLARGLLRDGEVKTGVEGVHYYRRAKTVWKHDETELTQPEDLNRIISAFAYALAERIVEKEVLVTAPSLCTSAVFWSIVEYLHGEKHVPTEKLIEGFCAAGIFASLMDKASCLSESSVGCQGPMGTACGMAAVLIAVALFDADIEECGRAFEMALEHCLGLICDCSTGLPIIPCIQRCAGYATRAYELAILNHSLMVTPELCKLDDVITVLKDTGADLLIKNKRLGMGGFCDHAKYSLSGEKK